MTDTTAIPPAKPNRKLGPIIISSIVVVGFIGVLFLLILHPVQIDDKINSVLQLLAGALSAKFGDVVQYHIGSSAGSRDKDEVNKAILLNKQ